MGNSQGGQSDNKNLSEKRNKSQTVRGRVLARFKSRSSLPSKDYTAESVSVANYDNDFTNIQINVPKDVHETSDIRSFEKIDKRISQISQGADSAKDALDFANQKQFDSEPSNVPFEQIYEIKTSATRASSTLPILPTILAKSFHKIPNELHESLTSTTSENTKTVTSSPADIHGLNQTTTTQTKAAERVSSKELWESTNVRTNNVFSNYLVLNDVAVSNSTLIDDTIFGNEKCCGDDSKINESKCESCHLNERYEPEKNIIFSTRSWNIARRINDLFKRRSTDIEITNKLTPSTTDIIVLREQTTSSSSDSIFTDPLTTPIGFATEINQCYYSEENVCDTSDVDKLGQLAEAAHSQSYSRKTKSNSDILNKLSKLSITNVDCYTTVPNYHSETTLSSSDELNCTMSLTNNLQKVTQTTPSNDNGSDKMNIFNVARIKKVELHDLSPSTKIGDESVSATINESQLLPTILQQQSISAQGIQSTPSTLTPFSTVQLAPVCSPTSQGDGNVLKKVASFTVERTNSDNTAYKISRPSYVPEKLNFGAYEKFEGQMLLNWMSSSSQLLYNVSDQDISQLIQQYCTNLLVAGVIKQIPDKYAPIQESFRPNLMYEWTHTIKPPYLKTTVKPENLRSSESIKNADLSNLQQTSDTCDVKLIQNRLNVAKTKLHECQMESSHFNVLTEVFKDLEMICIELLAVQRKLLNENDLLNETDNELYLSCVNETIQLDSFTEFEEGNSNNAGASNGLNVACLNKSIQSVNTTELENSLLYEDLTFANNSSTLEDIDVSTEDFIENKCDKIEKCKNCGKVGRTSEDNMASKTDVNRFEKWTQTESISVKLNESKENVETTTTPNNCQNGKVPSPPPMPPSFLLTPTAARSVPPVPPPMPPVPPPMPHTPSSIPPVPPPMPATPSSIPPAPPLMPPPPPPIPCGPPPPPMPGNIPSLSLSDSTTRPSPSIPPPPFGPPPPPLPCIKLEVGDTVDAVSLPSSNGLNGLVGPSSSKTQSPTTLPAPLPMPAVGNAWFQANTLRKNALKPPKPMKPLYWTRIVASAVTTPQSEAPVNTQETQLWQEIDETHLDNLDEFTELFSRPIVEPKKIKEETQKPVKAKTIKVLDSKRSQSVGIFSRSLHVNFHEIEHAIYHCDTSVVSLEALQTLMEIKATPEELELIKAAASQDAPLDPPEDFLLKISNFSCSAERISCIVFQSDFDEGSLSVTKKLNTVISLCEMLMENEDLKTLFSIILTLGNYMNGGNRQRGQADGFGLEILPKLKDVKSKDSKVTLLHFIVKTYISRCRKAGTPLNDIVLPIPDPGDVTKAVVIDFKEVEEQVNGLQTKLTNCRKITELVISKSTEDTLQPFKDQMDEFLDRALKKIEKLTKKLDDGKEIFIKTLKFYKYMPRSGPLSDVTPGQFYEYWAPFTNDFRDIWKKEMVLLNNEIMQKARALYNKNLVRAAERKITPTKPGSLKERMLRLRKKQNEKLS